MSDSLRPHESQHARPPVNSRSSPKLMSIESVMPSSHLILCHPLLLLSPNPEASPTRPLPRKLHSTCQTQVTSSFELCLNICFFLSSVQFSRSVVSDSLQPHGLQHARPPCPSPTPGVYSNSFPLSWWCHLTISSSVVPFSSHLQSFLASGSFQMSQFLMMYSTYKSNKQDDNI